MNLVERWFAELTNRKLRRSAHRSVISLETGIRKWVNEWNKDPKPFVWTKSADEILETLAAYCERINDSGHWRYTSNLSPLSGAYGNCAAWRTCSSRVPPISLPCTWGRGPEPSSCAIRQLSRCVMPSVGSLWS
jgi:hypothetical protein